MLEDFIKQFTQSTIAYIHINDKYYLKNERLQSFCLPEVTPDLFGLYLGKKKKNTFFPSFNLLDVIAQVSDEIIIVNQWGEIDFLYGKNLRKRHISEMKGSKQKGCLKLVQNQKNETLGYGKFIGYSDKKTKVLDHYLDRGIFIKRDTS